MSSVAFLWRSKEYSVPNLENATVGDLKSSIRQLTGVPVSKQVIIGLKRAKVPSDYDLLPLADVWAGKRLTVMGESETEQKDDVPPPAELNKVINDLNYVEEERPLPSRSQRTFGLGRSNLPVVRDSWVRETHEQSMEADVTRLTPEQPFGEARTTFSNEAPRPFRSSPAVSEPPLPRKEELESLFQSQITGGDFSAVAEALYGPNTLHFFSGSHEEAVTESKRLRRLLVVFFARPGHPQHDGFCHNVLVSPEVAAFFNENFVLRVHVLSDDALRNVSWRAPFLLNARSHPMMVVFANTGSTMSVVGSIDASSLAAHEFVVRMMEVKEAYGFMAQPMESEEARLIAEQDEAIIC